MSDNVGEKILLGVGKSQDDKNFVNYTYTREQWLTWLQSEVGEKKDGRCLTQGRVIGGRRLAKNMDYNSILMVDIDVGMTLDELEAKLKEKGLGAVIWSTFSHMKAESSVKELALTSWYRKAIGGELDVGDEKACKDAVLQYLTEVKGYYPAILDGAEYLGSTHTDGGIEYVVKHAPMPKYRALFFLTTPFSFSKDAAGKRVKQSERIALWSASYQAFCEELGIPYDKSCVDPSRLMFTRRVSNSPFRVFKIVEGNDLDLSLYEGGSSEANPFMRKLDGEGSVDVGPEFQTPGLLKFVAEYPDFDILAWAEHVGGDDKREGTPAGGGSTWTCPNEDNHTEGPNPDDKGFCLFQDTTGQRSWGASCRHSTCITMSNNDRVWYLDKMAVKYNADVETMLSFSGKAKVDEAAREAGAEHLEDEKKAAENGSFWVLIDKLTAGSTDQELDAVLTLVQHAGPADHKRACDAIKARTGLGLKIIDHRIREIKQKTKKFEKDVKDAAQKKGSAIRIPDPPQNDDYSKSRIIHDNWNWDDKVRTAVGIIKYRNSRNPRLFRDTTDQVCLLVKLPGKTPGEYDVRLAPMDYSTWFHELNTAICYQIVDNMGVNKNESIPKDLVTTFLGMPEFDVPKINQIIKTPIVGPDGKVRTERGYQKDLRVYLNPVGKFRDVPTTPTSEDLDEAVYWLFESVRDFPFSDSFGGVEDEPIYQEDADGTLIMGEDGYPLVNLKRGEASRLNTFALMLTPQLRHLLPDGVPVPGFHVDKPAPGSGAGFLVDLVSRIATGQGAVVQTLPKSSDEVRKNITSFLRDQSAILFFDNINHKVDSAEIAAALTSGTWRDRMLGHSQMVTCPITSTWVFAGNNLTFTSEMIRRLIPIRLDANTPNPALDRPSTMFKHNLAAWSTKERDNLVWSLQVMIVNWYQKGKPLPGQGDDDTHRITLNTFQDWADMIQGIFYAAGLDGVLSNVKTYTESSDTDSYSGESLIYELATNFGARPFSVREIEEALQDPFGGVKIELPFHYSSPGDIPYRLRYWMERKFKGNVFNLPDKPSYGPKGHELQGQKIRGQVVKVGRKLLYQLSTIN